MDAIKHKDGSVIRLFRTHRGADSLAGYSFDVVIRTPEFNKQLGPETIVNDPTKYKQALEVLEVTKPWIIGEL